MALSDLQVFLQQRLSLFDETLDVTPGSPVDTAVIQPVLRRLGTDPFTVDFQLFAQDRLQQEFPDLTTKEGDAIVDLLIKPATLLFDPLIRENLRVKSGQSFQDPTVLTTEEADALGANLFATRDTGNVSRGVLRIYFAQPQSVAISPANFATSRGGLHFFPTSVQSIRVEEMLFNTEGTLYYFDVNLVAENPGDEYNINADELVSIANLASATRITNKRRFRFGAPAETAAEFVGRAEQELTERSMVAERGVIAKLTSSFPEITQVSVVGFNDPEMHRDILKGGGLGHIVAAGFLLRSLPDGEGKVFTRRITFDDAIPVDFTSLIGPVGRAHGVVLTVHGGFGASPPPIRDLHVRAVVSSNTLDFEEQVLAYNQSALPWVLRKEELTLSEIPGGILFPDGPNGTVSVPDGQVHIGGATDFFVRATDFDASSLVLDAVVGDIPILSGTKATIVDALGNVSLGDLVLGTDYSIGDERYELLEEAYRRNESLQIENGPGAGSYNVIGITQTPGFAPVLKVDPPPANPPGTFRWRLIGVLDIDLVEPKETRIVGVDLITTQNVLSVTTAGGIDFQEHGVGQGDFLRVLNGPDKGDFVVQSVLAPFFDSVLLDRALTSTHSAISYAIVRRNKEGGVTLPLVRVESIDLLDTSQQSTGSKIPYALPVDARSRSFANVAHGVKTDTTDVILGIVGGKFPSGANVSGLSMTINFGAGPVVVTFSGGNPVSTANVVTQINAQVGYRAAVVVDSDRFGILPLDTVTTIQPTPGDAAAILFGSLELRTLADIRSQTVVTAGGWAAVKPAIDVNYDVVQVLDGNQIGFYATLTPATGGSTALLSEGAAFAPEAGRHAQMGARSLGSARLFFLEPTSIEFGASSVFTVTGDDGQILNFLIDRTLSYQKYPALPSDPPAKDGTTAAASSIFSSPSSNFFRNGIQVGDLLTVTYIPITGSVVLTDPVPTPQVTLPSGAALVYKAVILSIGGGLDKTIIFVNDSASIANGCVTRAGIADQINKAVGQKICSITSGNFLEFEADVSIIVRGTGTANTILGLPLTDTSNQQLTNSNIGSSGYVITALTATTLTVSNPPFGGFVLASRQHFTVSRPYLQRTVATTMATQTDVAGLYYCDVELISEGTGDYNNIGADLRMTVRGFVSDGYWLSTDDPNLTFSTVERPKLHISRSILEVGVSDSLLNVTQISGQNLQVNYERSALTASVQDFAMSDTERVVNESPLARHLIPYFVRFDANYSGGSREDVVVPDVETFIKELPPNQSLDVSALEKIFLGRGAVSVGNPIDLIAVIHNFNRSVTVERSQDRLNTGRLAAFIPDRLKISRRLA